MELGEALGIVVRERRQANALTLQQFAECVPMSFAFLSEFERGLKDVSSSMLDSICMSLGVPTHQIVLEAGHFMRKVDDTTRRLEMLAYSDDVDSLMLERKTNVRT